MTIVVKPIDQEFKIVMEYEESKIEFFIKQLDYKTKSHITGLVTKIHQGQVTLDSTLTCFYNLKYGLKRVIGMVDESGEPYKLEFDDKQKTALTDKCVDELFATQLSDNLVYTANCLSMACFPDAVLNPLTKQPIEGIEVISADKLRAVSKKS